MQYFSNYKNCKRYYDIYNCNLKCREYLKFNHNNTLSTFYLDDKLHNIYGPAVIKYYENRQKISECYFINDKLHNINGSAIIEYYENGQKYKESYFINNKLHNINGPAYIRYLKDGKKILY